MTHQDDRLRGTSTVPAQGNGTVPAQDPGAEILRDQRTGGRRPAPRRRPTAAWVWLVVGVGGLMTGIVVGHGLLIAAGLVAAGVGGQLFDPDQRRRRRPGHRTAL
ncbi:hypothetical protein PV394_18940 [Streptomyces sp. NE06-03E]|uniref:DUF3040 domain-containing protein n=2 Tax=Streptomyces TaxID=1883 RepID=A0A652LCL9_9ACTN|nr:MULTISPECIES: hypothetical protein [unclassified Streptomyces]WSS72669.1 hypothetical protein OG491_32260 [Streptomyces sp. NBC_01175]MDX3057196.1 hypothetical protein [Streptomyces sp. NE06-03E]MDX3328636.1 hypothetical protein [Streptomyces sp. ME02-6979-3A]MDX3427353.1 hypothetical protein [Streptomyces sp. ME01-18a]MDX3685308.1 hypothetical protein [Streptomyces sp. AK04-4c]